jgi:hypothetical protein
MEIYNEIIKEKALVERPGCVIVNSKMFSELLCDHRCGSDIDGKTRIASLEVVVNNRVKKIKIGIDYGDGLQR